MCPLSPKPLPSRLPSNVEQSSFAPHTHVDCTNTLVLSWEHGTALPDSHTLLPSLRPHQQTPVPLLLDWGASKIVAPHVAAQTQAERILDCSAKDIGYQFSSVTQSCLSLCDPMDCSMPGLPVHHKPPELAQTHVH